MTKILYSQSTGATLRYPRNDDAPIVGLDPDYVVLEQVKAVQPSYDPETQTIASQYVADLSAGEYRQEWVVTDRLAPPNWDAFNVYMLSDATFKAYRDTVRSTDGDLNAALFNAYGVIATNGVSAFSNVWSVWTQISGITQEDKDAIASVAAGYNLPSEFVNVITAG